MGSIKVLALAFLVLVAPGYASAKRPLPLTDEEKTVVQVFETPDYTKDQVFTASRMWIAEHFKSAKAVIEYENKDEGTIIGNGIIHYPCGGAFECLMKSDWNVPFTMKVESKDGKFRLTFTNIHLAWPAAYRSGISTSAADFEIRERRDLDKIKPELLKFGDEIVANMGKLKSSSDW
jgi:hypothetical protein